MGDKENALELHLRGLHMKRRWFSHPAATKVESLNRVAEQYMYRKDYDKALEYLREAVEMQKEVGDGEEQAALSNVNLGKVYLYTERYAEAEEQLRIATDWYEGRWGVHVWTAEALEFRGKALRGLGKYEEAKDTLTRALDMYGKVSGNVDVDEAIVRTRALLHEVTASPVSDTVPPLARTPSPSREYGGDDADTTCKDVGGRRSPRHHWEASKLQSNTVHDVSTDDVVKDVQATFATVAKETGYRWPDLARRLHLTEAQIQDVESKHRGDLKESCMDVLETWQKKEGPNVSIKRLREALVEASLKAIAEEIEDGENFEVVKRKAELQGVFYTVAEGAGTKWKDLARKLGLKEAQIDGIATRHHGDLKESCMDVLETWRLREGREATVQALQQALIEAELVALTDEIV